MPLLKRSVRSSITVSDAKTKLPAQLGDTLVSLALLGIHADSTSIDDKQPVQLLIVLTEVNPKTLQQLASSYEQIRGHQTLVPLVLTPQDLHSSTDVFPIAFMEMKRRNKVLAGADVLADLEVRLFDLRLRCEQELKILQQRMQNSFLKHYSKPALLQRALKKNLASLSRILPAALHLQGHKRPETEDEVYRAAARVFDLDQETLDVLCKTFAQQAPMQVDVLRSLYGEFIGVVSQMAVAVDALPERDSMVKLISAGE